MVENPGGCTKEDVLKLKCDFSCDKQPKTNAQCSCPDGYVFKTYENRCEKNNQCLGIVHYVL